MIAERGSDGPASQEFIVSAVDANLASKGGGVEGDP